MWDRNSPFDFTESSSPQVLLLTLKEPVLPPKAFSYNPMTNAFEIFNHEAELNWSKGSIDPYVLCRELQEGNKWKCIVIGSWYKFRSLRFLTYKDLPDHELYAAFSEGRYPDLESVTAFENTIMRCWRRSTSRYKIRGYVEFFAKQQKLIIRTVASIIEPRISRFYALLNHQIVVSPFLLTAVSLALFICWARRWRLNDVV
ncbi:hypothetical protein EJ04DRAFT_5858 [Polyplosphaeria fusca]|uniref:Uncharacterized protein n=1 Tax=Polyplosphaeria fusca TaxID=682080 RepID=A0A9P4V812_9PLEO|nr:hypothetical protein EJ04DRAFT_5858 [Polyplosphaeria fusca]